MSVSSCRRSRRKFSGEFKAEAVAMVEASGGKIAEVARELNIHDSSLGNWGRQAPVRRLTVHRRLRNGPRSVSSNANSSGSASATSWEKQQPFSDTPRNDRHCARSG